MESGKIIGAVFGTILKVIFAVVVVLAIYRGANFCYDYGYRIFTEPAVALEPGEDVVVEVTAQMSPLDIGESFETAGLVRDGKLFAIQYLLSEFRKEVQPGVFKLNTSMTAEDMMEVMATPQGEADEED